MNEQFRRRHDELKTELATLARHADGDPDDARSEQGQIKTAQDLLTIAAGMAQAGNMAYAFSGLEVARHSLSGRCRRTTSSAQFWL